MNEPLLPPPTVAQMQKVMAEIKRIKALNRPVQAERSRLIRENDELWRAGIRKLKPLPKLEHHLSEEHQLWHDIEAAHQKALERRNGREWAAAVRGLGMPVRGVVASIVWWDFFGDRSVEERWDNLDLYLTPEFLAQMEQYQRAGVGAVAAGLELVGYTPWSAFNRAQGNENAEAAQEGKKIKREDRV